MHVESRPGGFVQALELLPVSFFLFFYFKCSPSDIVMTGQPPNAGWHLLPHPDILQANGHPVIQSSGHLTWHSSNDCFLPFPRILGATSHCT
jgi:hypothetical protein